MFTAIYSIGKVMGVRNWVIGFFICAAVYLLACLIPKANRTGKGVSVILLSLLAVDIICDATWFMVFFPGGEYYNYGLLQGVSLMLLWPVLLIAAGIVGTMLNKMLIKKQKSPGSDL